MSNEVYQTKSNKASKSSVRKEKQQELNDLFAYILTRFTFRDIAELNEVSHETQYKRVRKYTKEVSK